MKNLLLFVFALLIAQLSHAQWEPDVRLTDTPDTSYLYIGMSHSIAASGDTVHVVWYDKSEGNFEIFYKRSTDGGLNWEQDTRISYAVERSGHAGIALSGSAIHVVWLDYSEGNREIYYNRSNDGGESWEGVSSLTNDLLYCYEPTIAVSGEYVHVVWVNSDFASFWQIFYKRSTDGGITWETENLQLSNYDHAYNPSIATSGSDVYIAWNDDRDKNLEIYYIKSSDNGLTWGPEIRLTNDPANSNLPSIAVSGSTVHIVWVDSRDGTTEIYYKSSIDGGANWGEDTPITFFPAATLYPNLAISNSVLHVVWQDYRNGQKDIFYNYSVNGGETWATETQLNDFSFSSQRPFIAASGPALHAIWYDYRDFNYEIYYKRNPTGGMVGVDERLRAESAGLWVYPNPACQQLTVGQLDGWAVGQSAVEQSDVRQLADRRSAVRLSIVDLFGREVMEYEEVPSFPYQINISGLPDGVYILKIINEDATIGSAKFLKISDK
jgi:hypothetical protein